MVADDAVVLGLISPTATMVTTDSPPEDIGAGMGTLDGTGHEALRETNEGGMWVLNHFTASIPCSYYIIIIEVYNPFNELL